MNTNKKYDISKYERLSVTVDALVFTISNDQLKVLLIKRGVEPFKDMWALPGGFVKMDEPLEEAVRRELHQEAGVKDVYMEQLYTFGDPGRDPRTRVITVSYMALVPSDNFTLQASTDAVDVAWFEVKKLPNLAFDHQQIIQTGLDRIKSKIQYSNIAYGLLPQKFRLSQLQKVYEIIMGKTVDKRNFRKKMLSLDLLKPSGEKELDGAHRPAMLYEFKKKRIIFFD